MKRHNTGFYRTGAQLRKLGEYYAQAIKNTFGTDFDVLFGIEEGVGGGKEVLLYGITPQVLYDHPELRDADLATISRSQAGRSGRTLRIH